MGITHQSSSGSRKIDHSNKVKLFFYQKTRNRKYANHLLSITGVKPRNIDLYYLAMRHTSVAEEKRKGFLESNERLEYLGDAVLGMVVAEYLFNKYPFKDERLSNRTSIQNS